MQGLFEVEPAAAYLAPMLGVDWSCEKVKLSGELFGAKGRRVAREESWSIRLICHGCSWRSEMEGNARRNAALLIWAQESRTTHSPFPQRLQAVGNSELVEGQKENPNTCFFLNKITANMCSINHFITTDLHLQTFSNYHTNKPSSSSSKAHIVLLPKPSFHLPRKKKKTTSESRISRCY